MLGRKTLMHYMCIGPYITEAHWEARTFFGLMCWAGNFHSNEWVPSLSLVAVVARRAMSWVRGVCLDVSWQNLSKD